MMKITVYASVAEKLVQMGLVEYMNDCVVLEVGIQHRRSVAHLMMHKQRLACSISTAPPRTCNFGDVLRVTGLKRLPEEV